MAKVTNNHSSALGLPGGIVIPAKGSADVDNWDKLKSHGVVSKWLAANILSVGSKAAKNDEPEVVENVQFTEQAPAQEEAETDDEDEQKAALIARLKELDIKADKRSSVEKLQEKLGEALAK